MIRLTKILFEIKNNKIILTINKIERVVIMKSKLIYKNKLKSNHEQVFTNSESKFLLLNDS